VEETEIAESFLKQFYNTRFYIPKSILLRNELADSENIEKWLTEKRGATVTLIVPKRGEKNRLLEMAEKNAHESFKSEDKEVNLSKLLAKLLGLSEITKIEAYDISNIGNDDIVGGMVTFMDSKPAKSLYRKFKIKTVQMQDDISCTYEVVSRRLKNANSKDEAFSVLPDLILADGGSGQVSAIMRAVDEAGYAIPVVGMVKNSKHQTKALLVNGKNIALSQYPEIFKFIYEVQEEVHRVAIGYNKVLRSKRLSKSVLDEIPGIGEARKKELLSRFKSIEGIRDATISELCEVKGINEEIAIRIKEVLE
jgi:excinuclease ABC subunit C